MLSFAVLALAVAAASAASDENCAPLPLDAQYWQTQSSTAVKSSNSVDGKRVFFFFVFFFFCFLLTFFFFLLKGSLVLSMVAADESLGASFGTEFAEAQDLTQHSLLSFNLFKVKSPASVFVSISTPHGVYRTPPATLFEQANTITVDLASAEFASAADATVFDGPIIGLSAVKSVALHLVAAEIGGAQVTVDSMVVCAAPHNDGVVEAAANATPLEFPDVAALSTALTTALGEVQRLAAEVGELKNAQRRARRSFDEFSASVRETLEAAVGSLSNAMSANVEQTLTNSKLLQRLRERIAQAGEAHDSRIVALDEQFSSLRSLTLKQGESFAEGVARTNVEERQADIATLQKRSAILAESAVAVEQRAEASIPIVGESFGLNLKKAKTAAKAAPVRAP
jgi:hypothetical protein